MGDAPLKEKLSLEAQLDRRRDKLCYFEVGNMISDILHEHNLYNNKKNPIRQEIYDCLKKARLLCRVIQHDIDRDY